MADDYSYDVPSVDDYINRYMRVDTEPTIPGLKRKKKPAHPALPPDEEKSILNSVLGTGIGGLQYLGETLDKPGRFVREGLSGLGQGDLGKVGKAALNLIPFSDTMGLTDPAKSVSGRDLLEQSGLLDKNTPGLDWGDVAGFGAELATDPLSYLSFGSTQALSQGGKILKGLSGGQKLLKGAGRLKTFGQHLVENPHLVQEANAAAQKAGTTVANLAGQQTGGLFGLTTGPLGLLGINGSYVPKMAQGPAAQSILGGLDTAAAKIGQTAPARFAKGLFQYENQGQFGKTGQAMAQAATESIEHNHPPIVYDFLKNQEELEHLVNDFHAQYHQQLPPGQNALSNASEIVGRAVQHAGETKGTADSFGQVLPGIQIDPAFNARANTLSGAMAKTQDALAAEARMRGGNVNELNQAMEFQHFARKANEKRTLRGTAARSDARRYLPVEHYEEMLHDPSLMFDNQIGGSGATLAPEAVISGRLAASQAYGPAIQSAAQASGKTPAMVAKELGGDLYSKGTKYLTSGKRFYNDLPVANHFEYGQSMGRYIKNMDAAHAAMAANLTTSTANTVPLSTAFADAGLKASDAIQFMATKTGQNPQVLSQMRVPEEVAQAAKSFLVKTGKPQWLEKIGNFVDDITKPFRDNVTLPWPGFSARNFASGQVFNVAMSGEVSSIPDLWKYKKYVGQAKQMLDNPNAHKLLMNEIQANTVFDVHNLGSGGASIGHTSAGWRFKNAPNPISLGGLGENLKQGIQQAGEVAYGSQKHPLSDLGEALPGPLKALRQGAAVPAKVGGQISSQVEWMNRVPMYLYLRDHMGWSAEAAASKVKQLQIDYTKVSPFEKDVMKRLVPFYSYARKSIPTMLEQIAHRPGGGTAQLVRASNMGRSEGEFVPPYVGEGMSVKLGDNTYLSGLGLPTDQFGDLYAQGPTAASTVARTGQKLLSMTNPYLKGPLEAATGQNFFTGRPMAESFHYPTGNPLVDQILHNSPVARAVTTSRQLMDERKSPATKALNTLTGVKITDVPGGLEKQQAFAESKILQEILRESPGIGVSTDVYQRKDPKTGKPIPIDETTDRYLRALGAIKKRQADEAKKKKKQLQP